MDAKEYLINYYENYDEEARLLSRHGMVEYLTTMKYIEKYITEKTVLLEIGAGTGRYSFALAEKAERVDAVELVQHNIEIFKSKMGKYDNVSISQGTATDLSYIKDNTYDITLLFGPMYHLFTKEEKIQALNEAVRVTKEEGIIFVAYCNSDASILDFGFKRGNIRELIKKEMLDTNDFVAHSNPWDIFVLHRKEDVDALLDGMRVERLKYIAADGFTNHIQEAVDSMDDEVFDIYMKYHYFLCEREDMLGITHHSLDILKKLPGRDNHKIEPEIKKEIDYYNSLPVVFDGFIDLPILRDNEIHLVCYKKNDRDEIKKYVPSYTFYICKGSEAIGRINLRIGYCESLYYGGQIGYEIYEKYRGNGYAARACRMLIPLLKLHSMNRVLITNNCTNTASRRVCEKLGAKFIRKAAIPKWHDMYRDGIKEANIFEWTVYNIE